MTEPLLEISDLTLEFSSSANSIRVLNRVNLSIAPGEAVGLVGESGSGKSMTSLATMRLPPGSGRVTSGQIRLEGKGDLLALSEDQMADIRGHDIAMIFQEPMSSLNPVMTVGDQIAEAIMLHQKMSQEKRTARVIELLGLVGIPDPVARMKAYPHQMSGGMRQRVMIAIAVACNPRLLIADEPTTALDVTIQAQVLDLLREVRQRLGTAVLMISHDLGVISELCDRVVVMYAGHVVETGSVDALFDNPQHPYTRGLLRAVPSLETQEQRLYQIPGSVPPPGTIKAGCPFAPRCEFRRDLCTELMPDLTARGPEQTAACWVTGDAVTKMEPIA